MRKLIYIIFTTFILFLSGCNSGQSNSSSSSINPPGIQIGTLPNGSAVYVSADDLPVSLISPQTMEIFLVGGSAGESFTMTFTGTASQTSGNTHKIGLASDGIYITPNSCILGTAGSGVGNSCEIKLSLTQNISAGTYIITSTATPLHIEQGDTVLNPVTILVNSSNESEISGTDSKSITSFSLNGTIGSIVGTNISITLSYGTDVNSLVASYITNGNSVTVNGVTQIDGQTADNFSHPVIYTVQAQDGSTQNYTVSVKVASSSDKAMTAFSLNGTNGVISGSNIIVTLPYGTNVNSLIADFTTTGQNVSVNGTVQSNGITPNNFSHPVIYTVQAQDSSTQNYTVTVIVAQWASVGNPGFSIGSTTYTSLAVDHGTPYLAYSDDANGNKATVMRFNGAFWEAVGNPGFSAGSAYYIKLVIDNGIPYVIYQDGGNSFKATVMKFNGVSWESIGNPGFSVGAAFYTTLVVSHGIVYTAYQDAANNHKATVMKFNGVSWGAVGMVGFSSDSIANTSLALDGNTPYIAYSAGTGGKATVMKFNGVSWEILGHAGFSTDFAVEPSLVINNGTPYLAYKDVGNNNKATVVKFNGISWVTVGNAGFSNVIGGTSMSFAISNDTLYMAYSDGANNYKTTVMKFNGNAWEVVETAGFSAGMALYMSLAIDNNGALYVAYADVGNNNKAAVMYYP